MTTIAATEAKNKFGELLEAVHREPIEISKKGRSVAVMLSIEDYEEMTRMLGKLQKSTDFSWLSDWRNEAQRSAVVRDGDFDSYHQYLDEKYGS